MDNSNALDLWANLGGGDLCVLDTLLKEQPMLLLYYERIVSYIAKYAEPGKDIPELLLRLLILNKNEVALAVLPKNARYREILPHGGAEAPKTLVALAVEHGFLQLLAHFAEPTEAFMDEVCLGNGLGFTELIPLLQRLIHAKPSLYDYILRMQYGPMHPTVLTELEKATHSGFEPRRTSTIIYRRR
jgi:hypothetical protein